MGRRAERPMTRPTWLVKARRNRPWQRDVPHLFSLSSGPGGRRSTSSAPGGSARLSPLHGFRPPAADFTRGYNSSPLRGGLAAKHDLLHRAAGASSISQVAARAIATETGCAPGLRVWVLDRTVAGGQNCSTTRRGTPVNGLMDDRPARSQPVLIWAGGHGASSAEAGDRTKEESDR